MSPPGQRSGPRAQILGRISRTAAKPFDLSDRVDPPDLLSAARHARQARSARTRRTLDTFARDARAKGQHDLSALALWLRASA